MSVHAILPKLLLLLISNLVVPLAFAKTNEVQPGPSESPETVGSLVETQDEEEDDSEQSSGTVTVRGQLVFANPEIEFELKGIPVILDEFKTPPKLPLPDDFTDMTMEQRQAWYAEFIESDAGKKYQAEVDEIQKTRHYEEAEADADGRFVFKKVKRSHYGLYGQKEFTKDGKTYIAEFQAEFPIEDKVKFIELDRLPVVIKRVLQVGETAPNLRLKELDGVAVIHDLKKYSGDPVLLYFWSISSAMHIQTELQNANDADLGIKILGINLNQPGEELDAYLKENPQPWDVLHTDGLDGSPVTIDYAINQLPSMWLIGKDGKILVTDIQFFQALSAEDANLTETLKKALAGKPVVETIEESDDDQTDGE